MMRLSRVVVVIMIICINYRTTTSIVQKNFGLQNIVLNLNFINESLKLLDQKLCQLETKVTPSSKFSIGLQLWTLKNNDCTSIYQDGYTESGVYNIWLTTGYRFLPIYCDMETRHPRTNKRGWMVIQRRYNGELNFNRTWQEYVDGFGSPHGEYWIGLENIYHLAKYESKLFNERSLMIDLTDQRGSHAQMHYEGFEIRNSTYSYMLGRLGLVGSIPPLEDGLITSRSKKFSTYDKNNQKVKILNCARISGGGWWFSMSCSWSNLNARYPNKNEKMSKSSIYWIDWDKVNPNNDALTNVTMKIQ